MTGAFYSATLIATAVVSVFLDREGCRRLLRRGRPAVRKAHIEGIVEQRSDSVAH